MKKYITVPTADLLVGLRDEVNVFGPISMPVEVDVERILPSLLRGIKVYEHIGHDVVELTLRNYNKDNRKFPKVVPVEISIPETTATIEKEVIEEENTIPTVIDEEVVVENKIESPVEEEIIPERSKLKQNPMLKNMGKNKHNNKYI